MTNFASDLELAEEVAIQGSLSWLYAASPGAEPEEDRAKVEDSSTEPRNSKDHPLF